MADTLRELSVRGHRVETFLLQAPVGSHLVDLRLMDDMPHILGNADPMHYAQLLPGVQTNSEYDAGLHVQGCDNAHNMVAIGGVPLYNVAHMLGFFSVFNTPHFSTMHFVKSPATARMGNRLGGYVDMLTADSVGTPLGGDLSVGPISSQGTLRIPVGSRSLLTVSARQAYLNLFYGQWMKIDEEKVAYTFGDYNLTWLFQPSERQRYTLDFYLGHDHMNYGDELYSLDTDMRWGNAMLSLRSSRLSSLGQVDQTLYYTHYYNDFTLGQSDLHVDVPSSITDFGYQLHWQRGPLDGGLHLIHHTLQPQDPHVSGQYNVDYLKQPRQQSLEASLYADYTVCRGPLTATAGLRTNLYRHAGHSVFSADPVLSFSLEAGCVGTFTLSGSLKHQYLHRVGFSDMGLPTEFWFSSSTDYPAQYAWSTSLAYETWLFGRMLHVTLEGYYKQLYHQQEFNGNVIDLLYSSYDLNGILLQGRGRNYGLNLLVEKRKGRITGWLSYSLGRAMRHFNEPTLSGWYPANHERIHELNAVATCRLSDRWSVGATYVLASGTPFTAPRAFYLLSDNIVSVFGGHNAERLHPYMRLDLSANYNFRHRNGRRSGLNLSVCNVTMHNNDLYFRLKFYHDQFAGKPFRFVLPIIPSINYYYHF